MGRRVRKHPFKDKGETNEILKNWAEENGYFIFHLDKSYANSYYHRKDRESKTDEVLITNYPVEEKSFEENGSDI